MVTRRAATSLVASALGLGIGAASGIAAAQDASSSVRDAGLAADVRAALAANSGPAANAIAVEVVDGVVRLGGHVRSESDRAAVLAAVDGVAGVESVSDAIRIGEPRSSAVATASSAAAPASAAPAAASASPPAAPPATGTSGASAPSGNSGESAPSTSSASRPNVTPAPDGDVAHGTDESPTGATGGPGATNADTPPANPPQASAPPPEQGR